MYVCMYVCIRSYLCMYSIYSYTARMAIKQLVSYICYVLASQQPVSNMCSYMSVKSIAYIAIAIFIAKTHVTYVQ